MEELQDIEEDAGLGNGGLGRLAGELMLLPEWLLSVSFSSHTAHCFHSMFPRLHGLSRPGCIWVWHPL